MSISVIVPVYNSALYLENCLSSILNQTYQDLEIICINDGSTDNSEEILHGLAVGDPRIRVISQPNSGVSSARNRGLEVASGEWISFIDSDDELESNMYEVLITLAKEHDADIVHCGYKRICLNGTTKDVRGTGELLIQTSDEASRCLIVGEHFSSGLWNKLFKRSLFSDIRFDTALKINEDVLVNVQVFHRAQKLVFLDVPKYHYFERVQSACNNTKQLKKKKDCIHAAEKMLEVHRGGSLENICTDRLRNVLIDLYRFYVLQNSKEDYKQIHQQISRLESSSQSARSVWNYRFMHYLPGVYRVVYRIYDKIRTPNWDV